MGELIVAYLKERNIGFTDVLFLVVFLINGEFNNELIIEILDHKDEYKVPHSLILIDITTCVKFYC